MCSEDNPKQFLTANLPAFEYSERTLKSCLDYGIGFIHDGMTGREISSVKSLFQNGSIRLIVVQESFCWDMDDLDCTLVAVIDAQRYDGKERRYVEYDIPTVIQM